MIAFYLTHVKEQQLDIAIDDQAVELCSYSVRSGLADLLLLLLAEGIE